MESNEYLNFAKEMCSEAGKIMKKYFYQDSGISYKGDRTIVTLADKEINHILIEKVKEKFPNHSVDGEEEKKGYYLPFMFTLHFKGTGSPTCHTLVNSLILTRMKDTALLCELSAKCPMAGW